MTKNTGFSRIVKASVYSYKGIVYAIRNEAAFRLELIVVAIFSPLALWLPLSPVEQAFLLLVLFIVLIVELINTAIEAVVDRIGSEIHPLAGAAKDTGSAAVLVSIIIALIVWGIIALPVVWRL